MSERYWISGVQIGLIKAQIQGKKHAGALRTLKEVEEKQFIGRFKIPKGGNKEITESKLFQKLLEVNFGVPVGF